MASNHPIIPDSTQSGERRGSPGRQSHSQRSSISGRSSNTGALATGDASAGAKPSTRGRKPFEISEEVDRGLVRVLDSTDVSFDKLAQAVEDSGGPRKLWLRRRFERITDTKTFGGLRLSNHRAGADERRRQQHTAMGLAVTQPEDNTNHELQDSSTQASASMPFSRTSWVASQIPVLSEQGNNLQPTSSTPNSNVGEASKRPGSLTLGPRRKDVGDQHRRRSGVRAPPEPPSMIGRSLTTPTPAKRALTEDLDEIPENDYGARKDRTRALSLGAIICRLEDLTGQTGLYQHIKRISVKSHISPRFPTFRFSSRGSRRASEGSNAGTMSMYEQQSPTGNEAVPIVYDPDPDYETFYHDPTPGRIARLEADEAVALVALMQAKSMSMSDEAAESHLMNALPDGKSALASAINATDDTGVTSLHLAVAYGYPRVCKHLMVNAANPFAVTNRGSSVCRFARPAQDFAKDTSLYHRILNCRQWICAGLPPPIATGSDAPNQAGQEGAKNSRPKQKRIKTNETVSTLFRVDETPTEDIAGAMNDSNILPRTSTVSDRYSGLTPLITGFDFGMRNSMHGNSAEHSASLYDENSPIAVSRRSCLRDHSTVMDLLTPNSFSPDTVIWPTSATFPPMHPAQTSSSLLPSSQPVNAETATHQYSFGGLNIYNGDLTTSGSVLNNHYAGREPVVSTSIHVPGIPTSYPWPAADLQHSGQMFTDMNVPYIPDSYSIRNATFDYQGPYQGGVSQPHYPTPPIDGRSVHPQESWPTSWDLPRATAMALAEASVDFSTTLWPEPPQHDEYVLNRERDDEEYSADSLERNHRSYYHNHQPNAYDQNDSAPF